MIRKFVNRENELAVLNRLHREANPKFILVYGRRRIGKTFLLKHFIQDKSGIYLLAQRRGIRENIRTFAGLLAEHGIPDVHAETLLELFSKIAPYAGKRVIIIDEFQYLSEADPAVLSDFQYIADEILPDSEITLVLCGSSMGMIERMGTELTSPLYGRFAARMKIKRMGLRSIRLLHPSLPLEQLIRVYATLGGIPLYHNYFDDNKTYEQNVADTFFSSHHPLYSEVEFLLRQEVRNVSTYMGILGAIANGKTRVSEIANAIYFHAKDIPKYMKTLTALDLVHRVQPIDARAGSKTSIYLLSDHYFRFWFRFVSPQQSKIEMYQTNEALAYLRKEITGYMGYAVEDIVTELFRERYTRVGKWWHREEEIDLVAVDEVERTVTFVEIKWRSQPVHRKIVKKLVAKSKGVRGMEGYDRKYLVISKAGFSGKVEGENLLFWGIDDLAREFNL